MKGWTKEQFEVVDRNWNKKKEFFLSKSFPPRIVQVMEKIPEMKDEEEPISQFIFGGVNTGKTIYAARLLLHYYKKYIFGGLWLLDNYIITDKKTFIFVKCHTILDELRETFSSKTSTEKILKKYREADYLVIDDFSIEKSTEWTYQIFYSLIDYRYEHLKITIFTSNKSLRELHEKEKIDDRLARRIEDMCEIIEKEPWDKT